MSKTKTPSSIPEHAEVRKEIVGRVHTLRYSFRLESQGVSSVCVWETTFVSCAQRARSLVLHPTNVWKDGYFYSSKIWVGWWWNCKLDEGWSIWQRGGKTWPQQHRALPSRLIWNASSAHCPKVPGWRGKLLQSSHARTFQTIRLDRIEVLMLDTAMVA